jgi:hypothetical protein
MRGDPAGEGADSGGAGSTPGEADGEAHRALAADGARRELELAAAGREQPGTEGEGEGGEGAGELDRTDVGSHERPDALGAVEHGRQVG